MWPSVVAALVTVVGGGIWLWQWQQRRNQYRTERQVLYGEMLPKMRVADGDRDRWIWQATRHAKMAGPGYPESLERISAVMNDNDEYQRRLIQLERKLESDLA